MSRVRGAILLVAAVLAGCGGGGGNGAANSGPLYGTGAVQFSAAFPTPPTATNTQGILGWHVQTLGAGGQLALSYGVAATQYANAQSLRAALNGQSCQALRRSYPTYAQPPVPFAPKECTQTIAGGLTSIRATGCSPFGNGNVLCYDQLAVANGSVMWRVVALVEGANASATERLAADGGAKFVDSFHPVG